MNSRNPIWRMEEREIFSHKLKYSDPVLEEQGKKDEEKPSVASAKSGSRDRKIPNTDKPKVKPTVSDARVRQLKDELIKARVFQGLTSTKTIHISLGELRTRIREVQRALGDATKDSELSKNAYEKLRALEQTLAKGMLIQDECSSIVKKLRAMLQSTEEQLRAHRKQAMFLSQLAAKPSQKDFTASPEAFN
ncbi:hypothetical protein HPP92_014939 [Vanilla planifolia]|uniref:Uncharacterized protein n=1 Tax=Vanilla planifolia TaxID=51239 RepID=A0A835UVA4_VANPL|nr:hypothetical protein HPP92_015458 [Vanilla planifolia]KAG0475253.1 hypothetical protein HPP92_014939 [Vanilla planifolia]